MAHDVDDPAIWVHPTDRARSLIVGTVKRPKPDGGLAVYDLGRQAARDVRRYRPAEQRGHPGRYLRHDGAARAATARLSRGGQASRICTLLGTVPVFAGEPGESGAPMGIALYQRRCGQGAVCDGVAEARSGERVPLAIPAAHRRGRARLARRCGRSAHFPARRRSKRSRWMRSASWSITRTRTAACACIAADPDAKNATDGGGAFRGDGISGESRGDRDRGSVCDRHRPTGVRRANITCTAGRIGRKSRCGGAFRSRPMGSMRIALPMGPRFPKGFLVAMNSGRHTFQLYPLP